MNNLSFVKADLSSMVAAKSLASTLPAADLLLLTTGIVPMKTRDVTKEGIEARAHAGIPHSPLVEARVPVAASSHPCRRRRRRLRRRFTTG